MARVRVLHRPVFYPEGPTWRSGRLYFVEYSRNVVALFEPPGPPRVLWRQPGFGPAATAFAPDGSLWVTGNDCNCLLRIDQRGGADHRVEHDDAGEAFTAPNDLVFDRRGGLYYTASGVFDPSAPIAGCVFYRDPRGSVRRVATAIHYANGIALSPDDATLFVSEHLQNRLLAFRVSADGSLSDHRIHADLHAIAPTPTRDPLLGPDGIACATDGSLVVAQFAGGRLLIVGIDGQLTNVIALPFRYPTNVTFGDRESVLYVTAFDRNEPPYEGALLEVDLAAEDR